MVYTSIELIYGVKADSLEEIINILKIYNNSFRRSGKLNKFLESYEYNEDDLPFYVQVNELLKPTGVTVFTPPCCAENSDKTFVLGVVLKEIPRLDVTCNECPNEYTLCDRCSGVTENGVYDISEMFDDFEEIDEIEVCKKCFYDKCVSDLYCNRCQFQNYRGIVKNNSILELQFKNLFDTKYYRIINDCAYCS